MIRSISPGHLALVFSSFLSFQLSAQTPAPQPAATPAQAPRRGFSGAGEDYKHYPQETLDAGKKYYTGNCAFCHGGSAKGGESGPSLVRSVIVLHDDDGKDIGAFIKVGRPDKGMPKFNLPEEQVKDISAFLHERVRLAAERSTYQILNIVVGDPKAGEAYFNGAGGCASCHSAEKDLAHIGGKFDAVDLQQKIVMPRGGRPSAGEPSMALTVKITQPSGEVMEGTLLRMDDFSVTFDQNGSRKTIQRESDDVPKVERHDPLQGHIDLLSKYTDSDIHNLTAYLVTLK